MNTFNPSELATVPNFDAEAPEETLDLVRYWRAINRNKWRILALLVAVGILATLYASSLRPTYSATTTVLIEYNKQKLVSIEEVYSAVDTGNWQHFQTQAEVLESRGLVERLVRELELTKHPEFDPRQQEPSFYAGLLPSSVVRSEAAPPPSDESIERGVVGAVQGRLKIQPVRRTQLVKISFQSHDPQLAAKVPNMLAELYVTADMEARVAMRQRAMTFLTAQAEELRKKVLVAEKALQEFRERERILDVKGSALTGAGRQLDELTSSLIDARRKRADAEAALNQVRAARGGAAFETLPAVLRHPLIQRAKDQESEAERKVADASKRYGSEHPRMIAAQAELRAAQENLRRQLGIVVSSIEKEYEVARANEAALERSLERAKSDIQSFNRKEFQLAALEREVNTNRQLYDMFMQRSKETNIASEMQSAIARVIDPAMVPAWPSGPNRMRIIGLSVLAALVVTVALALLLDRLDNTVKTSHEVESRLEVPAVGVVHKTRVKRGQHLQRLFLEDASEAFAEDIRTLRSGVLLSGLDSPQKTVLVTSSFPEEGKSTVAANLAFALSQVKKTLLIDADMRRPQIGQILGASATTPGLSNLVVGELVPEKCIFSVKGSNLFVLPSGRIPANPLELLSARRFVEVVENLKGMFEAIVIDSAPVQMVSDPLVISQVATAVLYVVKADDTPYPAARQGLRRLRRVNAHILGAVLNQLDAVKARKYYGDYSGRDSRYYRKYGYSKR